MKAYNVKVRDARPQIGIFEVVDGIFFYDSVICDVKDAAGGTVDGGQLFHKDLLKNQVYVDPRVSEASKAKIAKNGFNNWRAFPRGRVYYVVAEDTYYVAMHPSLNTAAIRNDIVNDFRLPRNKIKWTTDAEYMEMSE